MTSISPDNISVIVRGLIVGSSETDERKQFTKRALMSVRTHLPGAQIILSTWEGNDVSGLEYDDLILTEQPEMIYMTLPDGTRFANSTNHQILSTQRGLSAVRHDYVVVMRSDLILTGIGFIDYFLHYNRNSSEDVLKKRIVVLPTFNARKPIRFRLLFNTADWFFFGLTEDIKNIFDIPLMDAKNLKGEKVNGNFQQAENLGTEQYIWVNFLKKYKDFHFPNGYYYSEEAFRISEASYARNSIMVPAASAGVLCLKMPHSAYGAPPILSSGLYTFDEYKGIYNRYNVDKIFYIPNIPERILYALLLRARLLLKKAGPSIYEKVIGFIRARRAAREVS